MIEDDDRTAFAPALAGDMIPRRKARTGRRRREELDAIVDVVVGKRRRVAELVQHDFDIEAGPTNTSSGASSETQTADVKFVSYAAADAELLGVIVPRQLRTPRNPFLRPHWRYTSSTSSSTGLGHNAPEHWFLDEFGDVSSEESEAISSLLSLAASAAQQQQQQHYDSVACVGSDTHGGCWWADGAAGGAAAAVPAVMLAACAEAVVPHADSHGAMQRTRRGSLSIRDDTLQLLSGGLQDNQQVWYESKCGKPPTGVIRYVVDGEKHSWGVRVLCDCHAQLKTCTQFEGECAHQTTRRPCANIRTRMRDNRSTCLADVKEDGKRRLLQPHEALERLAAMLPLHAA